jgi:hypothetical protein
VAVEYFETLSIVCLQGMKNHANKKHNFIVGKDYNPGSLEYGKGIITYPRDLVGDSNS